MKSILVVHRSKVIRATLSHHLKPDFEILEASDSDSGWELLVLQHGVSAVICGLDVSKQSENWATTTRISGVDPQLSGIELLDRVRDSSLSRLKSLPFYLIGSETHISDIAEDAHLHGVTGFLHNGVSREDILSILNSPNSASAGEKLEQEVISPLPEETGFFAPHISSAKPEELRGVQLQSLHKVDLLSPTLFRENLIRVFERPGTQMAVLVFGIDQADLITSKLGGKALGKIVERAADLVRSKLMSGDSLGHVSSSMFAVLTPVAQLGKCAAFSIRVVQSLSDAKVAVQGKPVKFSWSAGMSSSQETGGLRGEGLLDLAQSRLKEAQRMGGRRVYPEG